LHKAFQSGDWQANAKVVSNHRAGGKLAVTRVEGDLDAEAAAEKLGVEGVGMLFQFDLPIDQSLLTSAASFSEQNLSGAAASSSPGLPSWRWVIRLPLETTFNA
jgi:hypothetical protein